MRAVRSRKDEILAFRHAAGWEVKNRWQPFEETADGRVGIVLRDWLKKMCGAWFWDRLGSVFRRFPVQGGEIVHGSSMCSRSELRESGGCFFSQFYDMPCRIWICVEHLVSLGVYSRYSILQMSRHESSNGIIKLCWWVGIPHATTTPMHIETRID